MDENTRIRDAFSKAARMNQPPGRFIVRLGKDGGEFEPRYDAFFREDFATFLACLTLTRAHRATKERVAASKKPRRRRTAEPKNR